MRTWLAVQHPERRAEVIAWFQTLLVFYDGKLETRQCSAYAAIGMITGFILDLHAEELLPELKKLYDTGLVDEKCSGNFKTVVKEMKNGMNYFCMFITWTSVKTIRNSKSLTE